VITLKKIYLTLHLTSVAVISGQLTLFCSPRPDVAYYEPFLDSNKLENFRERNVSVGAAKESAKGWIPELKSNSRARLNQKDLCRRMEGSAPSRYDNHRHVDTGRVYNVFVANTRKLKIRASFGQYHTMGWHKRSPWESKLFVLRPRRTFDYLTLSTTLLLSSDSSLQESKHLF